MTGRGLTTGLAPMEEMQQSFEASEITLVVHLKFTQAGSRKWPRNRQDISSVLFGLAKQHLLW